MLAAPALPSRPQPQDPAAQELELSRIWQAFAAAETRGDLASVRDELEELIPRAAEAASTAAKGDLAPTLTWARSLLGLSCVAAELGDETLASASLTQLRGWHASEAWELAQIHGFIGGLIAEGALERAAGAADWALASMATEPRHRSELLLSKHWALRTLGAHDDADGALAALEAEIEALRGSEQPAGLLAYLEARRHLGRAQGWMSLGVLDQAADELEQALAKAAASGNLATELAAVMAQGDMYLLAERRSLSFQVIDQFLEQHAAELAPELRSAALLQRAVALSELERVEPAVRGRAEAELRAVLGQADGREDLRQRARLELVDLLLRPGFDTDRRSEAGKLLDEVETELNPKSGLETQALATAQRARWLLAGKPTAEELEAALRETEAAFERLIAAWRRAPRERPGGLGFLQLSHRRMLLTAWIDLLIARDPSPSGLQRALDVVIAAQAEGGLAADLGGGVVSLALLRERFLGADHGCVVLLPGRHDSHLFAFDRETILHRRLSARAVLAPEIDAFSRDLLATAERRGPDGGALLDELLARAEYLAQEFFPADVRARIASWRTVTVVGTELFKGLPVECLPVSPGGLLGLTHAVDVVPSLPLAARLHELALADSSPAALDLVFVGDLAAQVGDGLSGLQAVEERDLRGAVAPLLEQFPEERMVALLGKSALWGELASVLRERGAPQILHVLAHGAYDAERERGAALVLGMGAGESRPRVFAEDVEALPACGRLVVLSACASARGPERLGSDNLAHLGGAFLRSGARCVILTRADVALGSTLHLDAALHAGLAAGLSAAEALRGARAAAVDEDPFGPFLVGRVQAYGLGSAALALQ